MEYKRCEKCYEECACYGIHMSSLDNRFICGGCFDEFYDSGYWDMWRELYHADSFELADKFILDFLGKLGK